MSEQHDNKDEDTQDCRWAHRCRSDYYPHRGCLRAQLDEGLHTLLFSSHLCGILKEMWVFATALVP